ncbi:MAG: dihydrolipoyl dehydrogenase [Bacteroidales bacterium]
MTYQLAIIGGGPAGYTAAEKAAQAGLSVILFERNALGGVCLNEGCIPTKTLLYSAKMYDHFKVADKFGLSCAEYGVNLPKIQSRKNKIIRKLTAGIRSRLTSANVTMVNAEAGVERYASNRILIQAAGETYEAERLLLATGSESWVPPIPGIETASYWTSADALRVDEIPAELTIVGGGVIGMEFAGFFQSMGTKVTIIEMLPEILAGIDGEIAALYREEFRKKGVAFYLSARVEEINGSVIRITHDGEEKELSYSRLLIAAGRRPVLRQGSELPYEMEGKRIRVNRFMQTSLPNVYACGDITGVSMLAHTAEREAAVAVNHMLGIADEMSYRAIPGVVYTSPEVAAVGYTEEQLKERGIAYSVRKLPMSYAGRFVVENEGFNGLCKLLVSESHTVLGVHILGTPSSEFIVAAGMAIEHELTLSEWEKTVFPHPTVSEILKEVMNG